MSGYIKGSNNEVSVGKVEKKKDHLNRQWHYSRCPDTVTAFRQHQNLIQ